MVMAMRPKLELLGTLLAKFMRGEATLADCAKLNSSPVQRLHDYMTSSATVDVTFDVNVNVLISLGTSTQNCAGDT